MLLKPGQNFNGILSTVNPATGIRFDATTPAGRLYRNGIYDAIAGGITADDEAGTSGLTRLYGTIPADYAEGDIVTLVAEATVDAVVAYWPLWTATIVGQLPGTRLTGDYPTAITYNAHGDIDTVTWSSLAVWTYVYDASYNLTGVTEA